MTPTAMLMGSASSPTAPRTSISSLLKARRVLLILTLRPLQDQTSATFAILTATPALTNTTPLVVLATLAGPIFG